MLDLNGKEFQGTTIFNGGNAGKAENVEISIEKRKADEPDNRPDYKMIMTDEAGAKINEGFYYPKANPQKTDEQNQAAARRELGRVVAIARAIMGNDYEFPQVGSIKEGYDTLFKIISDNAGGQKVNVFVTYGNTGYPKKYLELRYFDFIENVNAVSGKLKQKNDDLMERLEADPVSDNSLGGGMPQPKQNWNNLL